MFYSQLGVQPTSICDEPPVVTHTGRQPTLVLLWGHDRTQAGKSRGYKSALDLLRSKQIGSQGLTSERILLAQRDGRRDSFSDNSRSWCFSCAVAWSITGTIAFMQVKSSFHSYIWLVYWHLHSYICDCGGTGHVAGICFWDLVFAIRDFYV